jgi:mannose-6-phosphate isomerase-like protein (cupin superfamily)
MADQMATHGVTRWADGKAMPWQVLIDGDASGGKYLIGEARLDPGAPCPAQHVHTHEHESLYVIDGVLTVELGDERIELRPGECLVMPPGVPHRFANLSDQPVRAIGTISPTAIEQMFAEEEAYFSTLDGPPDPAVLTPILDRYEVTVVGAPLT